MACVISTITPGLLTRITACLISTVGEALIQYPNLHQRIQKLGAYFAAAVETRDLFGRPEYCKLVSNIRYTEVSALISSLYITNASQRGLQSTNY